MPVMYRYLCRFKRLGLSVVFLVIVCVYVILGLYMGFDVSRRSLLTSRTELAGKAYFRAFDFLSQFRTENITQEYKIPDGNHTSFSPIESRVGLTRNHTRNYSHKGKLLTKSISGSKTDQSLIGLPFKGSESNTISNQIMLIGVKGNNLTKMVETSKSNATSFLMRERDDTTNDKSTGVALQQENVILAGVPRKDRVFLSIGMVTVHREKGNYFFGTLASLFDNVAGDDLGKITVVVMLADRDPSYNTKVLTQIQKKYPTHLQNGALLVIRGAKTAFLFQEVDLKRTYNDSVRRVQWRSKQNLDYAAIMEFSGNISQYYLHIEDDVIAASSYLRHLEDFIRSKSHTQWAMLEVSPRGFIGKIFKTVDLPKLVVILRTFYLEQPCDFLIKPFFINLMTQPKPIIRAHPLFFHQGHYSSLHNVTRPVDKIPAHHGQAHKVVEKFVSTHTNPPATVLTNMPVYNKHEISNAYDIQAKDFFWTPEAIGSVMIVFSSPQRVKKVVINTGFSAQVPNDILHDGSLSVGSSVPDLTESLRCPGAIKIGNFQNGSIAINVTLKFDVSCMNINVESPQKEWLIIREIFVYA